MDVAQWLDEIDINQRFPKEVPKVEARNHEQKIAFGVTGDFTLMRRRYENIAARSSAG